MMRFSEFGDKFSSKSGIALLMDDLGAAMAGHSGLLMLGGGNPAHVPGVEKRLREEMEHILECDQAFEQMVGHYDGAAGNRGFIVALAKLLSEEFGLPIGPENIALTNGSQNAFFYLFNLFAGRMSDGTQRKILLPLAPEYIGYSDVGLSPDFFQTNRPRIEMIGDDMFKYHVDFETLQVGEHIGAICVSRPTNPTGNVLSDNEILKLDALAKAHGIPLIIDNAYGTPFPDIIFTEAQPCWNDNTILCMSLSKFGLPSCRTGIIIAKESIISRVSELNGIMGLAPGGVGPHLVRGLFESGEIIRLSRECIQPFYRERMELAVGWVREFAGDLPLRIHKPEGALFLWLWFETLPISSQALYELLKERGVLVVSGHYFFPGISEEWNHTGQCLRITYSQSEAVVRKGIQIIAETVRELLGV